MGGEKKRKKNEEDVSATVRDKWRKEEMRSLEAGSAVTRKDCWGDACYRRKDNYARGWKDIEGGIVGKSPQNPHLLLGFVICLVHSSATTRSSLSQIVLISFRFQKLLQRQFQAHYDYKI